MGTGYSPVVIILAGDLNDIFVYWWSPFFPYIACFPFVFLYDILIKLLDKTLKCSHEVFLLNCRSTLFLIRENITKCFQLVTQVDCALPVDHVLQALNHYTETPPTPPLHCDASWTSSVTNTMGKLTAAGNAA